MMSLVERSDVVAAKSSRRSCLGWVGVGVAWICVGAVEVVSLPTVAFHLLPILVPVSELVLWGLAGWLTLRLLRRAHSRRFARVTVAIVIVAACVHFTNWAAYQPVSYYATHQYAFDAVAAGIRNGSVELSDAYYGEPLPWYLRDLSTSGRAAIVGSQDGMPVVFLPQWIGVPDDAGGYVFFDGDPRPDLVVNLFGEPVHVSAGVDLGNGWWYLQPGDSHENLHIRPRRNVN